MNEDLISRSALRAEIESYVMPILTNNLMGASDAYYRILHLLDGAPAVDAETVFEQIGLVKEAFEMAKADLMQIVQCKDCLHRETTKCPLCIVEFSELPDGKLHKHVIHNFVEDDFWCKKGERRADK